MMYAIQNDEVRWFLTSDEESHLFSLFDLSDVTAEIIVHGNWNEYLTFKPIVYKSRREPNTNKGSFTVLPLTGPDNTTIKTISVPIEHLKVNRATKPLLPTTGTVLCTHASVGRELLVYPTQLLDQPSVDRSTLDAPLEPQPSPEPSEPVSSSVIPVASPNLVTDTASLSEQVAWTKEVVTEINAVLDLNPEITVTIAEGGRSVKFLRRVISRRTIA